MALYHKWDVKNGFAYVVQFLSLISDGLGGVRCLFPTFYDMKNQFWAGLGSRAVLVKKKFGADYEQLLRAVFYVFRGKKNETDKMHLCAVWTLQYFQRNFKFIFCP